MAEVDLSKLRIDKKAFKGTTVKRTKKPLIVAVIILVIVAAFVLQTLINPTVTIETATVSLVYPSQTFTLLNASGYVVAQRKASVATKATGRLDWLGVEEGSRVKKGDIIARLERADVIASSSEASARLSVAKAQLEQSNAELEDATLNYERTKALVGQGIVSKSDYDAADARYRKAKAGMAAAKASIAAAEASLASADVAVEYTLIRAPFDAVVLTKNADVGDIVTPLGAAADAKAAVVTIADMDSLVVEADVSESNLAQVKAGQPCEIQLDALPDKRFRGEVHMIVPTADRSKASVLVKVRFLDKDRRILPEMSAKVAFLERQVTSGEMAPKTAVNPDAVVARDGKKFVYLVQGDRGKETPVTVGAKIGDLIEVAGVKGGDKVVVKPVEKMKDGIKVKVEEK